MTRSNAGAVRPPNAAFHDVRHRAAHGLGVGGAALGVLAGTVQATVGDTIPAWTGHKLDTTGLGLLTIVLSVLAGLAATWQRRPDVRPGARAGCALLLLTVGLVCFSTVGRLWYVPGVLLLLAGLATVDSLTATAALVGANWLRCLLGALGACELLMAAGGAPLVTGVGTVGGAALIAAAWLTRSRRTLLVLTALGTVPFAALAWTAVLPIVLLLTAVSIAVALARPAPAARLA